MVYMYASEECAVHAHSTHTMSRARKYKHIALDVCASKIVASSLEYEGSIIVIIGL